MTQVFERLLTRITSATMAVAASAAISPAVAHPHVFVSARMVVDFKGGAVTAVQQAWTFDEMYAVAAIEGLDANKDGTYDREELTALAQVNMDGLKEFNYFTTGIGGGESLEFGPPADYWLEYENNLLILHFSLPLAKPLEAKGKAFKFTIQDETFFIAFEFEKADPAKLSREAPAACHVMATAPVAASAQNLSDAFSSQLGPPGSDAVNTVDIQC